MHLELSQRVEGDKVVVAVAGEVDAHTAPELDDALSEIINEGDVRIVVDLSNAGFLDSTGLGVLVKALKRSRDAGGFVSVVADQERIVKVFRITGLEEPFAVTGTLSEALTR